MKTWFLTAIACAALAGIVRADTLVLRDGRRVQGELVSVRGDEIEFDGQRGLFGGRERVRVDRRDVARIEFEDNRDRNDRFDRDDDRRGDGRRPSGMRERG